MTPTHVILALGISLDDPEHGFSYRSEGADVVASYVDWQNNLITLRFTATYLFSHRLQSGYRGLPEGAALALTNSPTVTALRDSHTASADEPLTHYLISTNEDEWLEVIASDLTIIRG